MQRLLRAAPVMPGAASEFTTGARASFLQGREDNSVCEVVAMQEKTPASWEAGAR